MKHPRTRAARPVRLLALALCIAAAAGADDRRFATRGTDAAPSDPTPASERRQYAPERTIDIRHLALDVTPDFKRRTIAGRAVITFEPVAPSLRELALDAENLTITEVTASEPIQGWQNTGHQLVVTFADPVPSGRQSRITVGYWTEPAKGLYFRTPEMGYRDGETHLFTQGQAIDARYWYPGHDAPNEKFTSEVTCRVPEGMTVLSNGRRMSETRDALTGLVAVRWLQDKPHVNYLVALVAGYFSAIEDVYRDIPLSFHTLPSVIGEAPNSFRDTKDMMGFFEQEIGVPYPWARYAQVCVNDFVAGGMENTTLTILTDSTLFSAACEGTQSSQGLVAHELVHMWFGDLVTCKDWSHLWLNEGFATYYEALYDGHKNGRDAFLCNMREKAQTVLAVSDDTRPIVHREFGDPGEQFSYLAYPKGAWVTHMLRSQLGEDLFRRCVRSYLERHQYDSVVTEDLNAAIEDVSGRSFDRFFDQWIYHAHYPELEIRYSWDESARLARLNVRQVQALSDRILLFQFPLPVRFACPSGLTTNHIVTVKEKAEDFSFALPEAPRLVRVDPDSTVLAKVKFEPPPAMLALMLTNTTDVLGRLMAVEHFASRKDSEAVAKLRIALENDPFFGVRLEAARALGAIRTDEVLEALLASANQPDPQVRRQVRENLQAFYRQSVFESTRAALDQENNLDIQAILIRTLGAYPDPQVLETLLRFLKSRSYENRLADAAIDALRTQDDPASIPTMLEVLRDRHAAFTAHGLASGLITLAHLARHEEQKQTVREFLIAHLNDRRDHVRRTAIEALGGLGDPKAIPALTPFTRGAADNSERHAAQRAIASLRAPAQPADDLRALREEILALQRQNRDLEQGLEELKARVAELPSGKAAGNEPNAH